MAKGKKSDTKWASRHKGKGRNDRESRKKYWYYEILKRHKVRNLVNHNGMTRADAIKYWDSVRTRRIRTKF